MLTINAEEAIRRANLNYVPHTPVVHESAYADSSWTKNDQARIWVCDPEDGRVHRTPWIQMRGSKTALCGDLRNQPKHHFAADVVLRVLRRLDRHLRQLDYPRVLVLQPHLKHAELGDYSASINIVCWLNSVVSNRWGLHWSSHKRMPTYDADFLHYLELDGLKPYLMAFFHGPFIVLFNADKISFKRLQAAYALVDQAALSNQLEFKMGKLQKRSKP